MNASPADIEAVRTFVNEGVTAYSTYFPAGLMDMAAFFAGVSAESNRIVFFVTDGGPNGEPSAMTPVEVAEAARALVEAEDDIAVYGINIDLTDTTYTAYVDNTPEDGVPVIDGSDPIALTGVIISALGIRVMGMNPAHIVYQCLSDPNWGMGYPVAQIDDASFTAAADQLFDENFGLCLIWNQQQDLQSFIQIVLDHCGGILYVDPRTGKFALKLIRDDYDAETLPVFGEDEILSVESFQRPGYGETVNEITVVYRDICSNTDATVTVQNLANIQAQGGVVSQTRQYPGLPVYELASRVAMRDLNVSSTPLARATIRVNRSAWALIPGDVIKLNWPKLGLAGVIMRVLAINNGTLTDGAITVELAEDVFGLPDSSYAEQQDNEWQEPDTGAGQIQLQQLQEAPYWEIVQEIGQDEAEQLDADVGFVGALATRESGLWTGYGIFSRVGSSEFEENGIGSFGFGALLSAELAQPDTTLAIEDVRDITQLEPGQLLIVGTGRDAEWMQVLSVDVDAPSIEVARGMLDTTPQVWPSGTRIWLGSEYLGQDQTERATGELVNVRLQARATGGKTPIGSAIQMDITMDQRYFRPYPPGNVLINGEPWPSEIVGDGIVITWSHRDRIQQTAYLVEQDEGDIGPEPGTTYNVRVFDEDYEQILFQAHGIEGKSSEGQIGGLIARRGMANHEFIVEVDGDWFTVNSFETGYGLGVFSLWKYDSDGNFVDAVNATRHCAGLVTDGTYVYLAARRNELLDDYPVLRQYDTDLSIVEQTVEGDFLTGEPTTILYADGSVWVTCYTVGSGTIFSQGLSRVSFGPIAVANHIAVGSAISAATDGTTIWVYTPEGIHRVDAATNTVTDLFEDIPIEVLVAKPRNFGYSNGYLWAPYSEDGDQLVRIDPDDGSYVVFGAGIENFSLPKGGYFPIDAELSKNHVAFSAIRLVEPIGVVCCLVVVDVDTLEVVESAGEGKFIDHQEYALGGKFIDDYVLNLTRQPASSGLEANHIRRAPPLEDMAFSGPVCIEIESERDGVVSWQPQRRCLTTSLPRLLEDDTPRLLEDDTPRQLE
jgi:hypothetical protein